MKIYPVIVNIEYTSGRTERQVINKDWPSHYAALRKCMRLGSVKSFTSTTAPERAQAWNAWVAKKEGHHDRA